MVLRMPVKPMPLDKKAMLEPLITREVAPLHKEQAPLEPEEVYMDLEMQPE